MKTKLDFLGMPIRPPCTVVYPVRRYSSMWLNKLTVERVQDDAIIGFNDEGRRIVLRNFDRVVVVPDQSDARDEDLFDADDDWGL